MENISRQEYLKRWYQNRTEEQIAERNRRSLQTYHRLQLSQKLKIRERQREYYQENKEKLKEYSRNYYHNVKKLRIFAKD
jgi:hypothetical protein